MINICKVNVNDLDLFWNFFNGIIEEKIYYLYFFGIFCLKLEKVWINVSNLVYIVEY